MALGIRHKPDGTKIQWGRYGGAQRWRRAGPILQGSIDLEVRDSPDGPIDVKSMG
jgi:hypothetical protein